MSWADFNPRTGNSRDVFGTRVGSGLVAIVTYRRLASPAYPLKKPRTTGTCPATWLTRWASRIRHRCSVLVEGSFAASTAAVASFPVPGPASVLPGRARTALSRRSPKWAPLFRKQVIVSTCNRSADASRFSRSTTEDRNNIHKVMDSPFNSLRLLIPRQRSYIWWRQKRETASSMFLKKVYIEMKIPIHKTTLIIDSSANF